MAAAGSEGRVKLSDEYSFSPLDELGSGSFAHVYRGADSSVRQWLGGGREEEGEAERRDLLT
jgi:hypothetical protein